MQEEFEKEYSPRAVLYMAYSSSFFLAMFSLMLIMARYPDALIRLKRNSRSITFSLESLALWCLEVSQLDWVGRLLQRDGKGAYSKARASGSNPLSS